MRCPFLRIGIMSMTVCSVIAGDSASTAHAVPPVPVRDVTAEPWGVNEGFLVSAMLDYDRVPAPREDGPAAKFRAGWTPEHLRVLVEVRDTTPMEDGEIYRGDSVEIMIAHEPERGEHRLQFIIAPGRGLDFSEPRLSFYDHRPHDKRDARPDASFAARALPRGYAVELAVPWADIGLEPEDGRDFALQVEVNDRSGGGMEKLRWFHLPAGGDGWRPMPAVRLTTEKTVAPERFAKHAHQARNQRLSVVLAGDGAWAGRTVAAALDGEPVGTPILGPDHDGWAEMHFFYPDGETAERDKRPRGYVFALPDGSAWTVPYERVLPFDRPLAVGMLGENYHFNATLRYLAERLGEDRAFFTYALFARITGDAHVQVHGPVGLTGAAESFSSTRGDAFERDCLVPAFDALGYEYRVVTGAQAADDPEGIRRAILADIERGRPVLLHGGALEAAIMGYRGDGTLLTLRHEAPKPVPLERPLSEFHRIIFAGDRKEPIPRAEVYRRALLRIPELLTHPRTDTGIAFGREAYEQWADSLADPAIREMIREGVFTSRSAWWAHGNQVCLTLTNEHKRPEFLRDAATHCPDMAPIIAGLDNAHGILRGLHREQIDMKAGFALGPPLLDDPEGMEKVRDNIRRMGAVCDHVLAVFRDPAKAKADAEAKRGPVPANPDVF